MLTAKEPVAMQSKEFGRTKSRVDEKLAVGISIATISKIHA